MKNLVREPLLQFFVLAAILFAFDYFWSATKKERIVVDRQSAEYLIERREFLEFRGLLAGDVKQPTEEQLREYFDANTERFMRSLPRLSQENLVRDRD